MQQGPYYDSPILNEIHTHFPALLYNTNQFQNMNSVFRYVREQMRNRYDVFSTEQQRYNSSRPTRQRNFRPEPPSPRVYQPPGNFIDILNSSDINRLFSFAMGIPLQPNFMDPVIVAPTALEIHRGSIIQTATADSDTPCAVCQAEIRTGEIVRSLNHCVHTFHRTCIDTWYQRNVHCPVCRHDIRAQPHTRQPV